MHHLAAVYCTLNHLAAVYCTLHHSVVVYCTMHHLAAVYCTLHHLAAVYCTMHHLAAVYRPPHKTFPPCSRAVTIAVKPIVKLMRYANARHATKVSSAVACLVDLTSFVTRRAGSTLFARTIGSHVICSIVRSIRVTGLNRVAHC
jgi:hypothetical protein